MRPLLALPLALTLCASSAAAQLAGRGSAASTEQELTRLENLWTTALVRRDTATFRRMLDPRFVYTENADVSNANELIRGVMGTDTVTAAFNEQMTVHDFGGAAVVTGILNVRGRGREGRFSRRYRFTDTWQRTGNGWRMIAAQDYVIPTPARRAIGR